MNSGSGIVPASIGGRATAKIKHEYGVRMTSGPPIPFRSREAAEKWIADRKTGTLVDRLVYTTDWSTAPI